MSDKDIEQEIKAKGLTAPRITPADIESNIAWTFYFTGSDGVMGAELCRPEDEPLMLATHESLSLLTFCVLILKNGFTVTGESACASPDNFDAEIGRKIARQNAIAKVWPLMGYELRSVLSGCFGHKPVVIGVDMGGPDESVIVLNGRELATHQQRVVTEKAELDEKIDKLTAFIDTPVFAELNEAEQERLVWQLHHMGHYTAILGQRIAAF